jgi:hypothetical protein
MEGDMPAVANDRPKDARTERVPSLEEVAFIATLDVFGIVFTATAVVVVMLNAKTAPWWVWASVVLAVALSVVTTAVVVRLAIRRREDTADKRRRE